MKKVREFMVQFHSVWDMRDFASLAEAQPHTLSVGNDRFQVHASSFMSMFALNCRKPLRVTVDCSDEELQELMHRFSRFLAK